MEITTIAVSDLKTLISEAVAEQLATLQPTAKPDRLKYLTRKEAAAHLRISLPTLNELTKRGDIIGHRIGGRLLYSEDSISNAGQSTDLKRKGGRK